MSEEEIISICKKEVADAIVKYSLINVCQDDINDLICYSFEDSLKFYKAKNIINEKIIRIIVKRLLGIRNLEKKFQMELSAEERYSQIIDEVYSYYDSRFMAGYYTENLNYKWFTKEDFIREIKTNKTFSEECKLKIEERELSLEERYKLVNYDKEKFASIDEWISWFKNQPDETYMGVNYNKETTLNTFDVPTKIITVTYNNETIESYE